MELKDLTEGWQGFKFEGFDNYKKPKTDYLKTILAMNKEQLGKETESKIWLSSYANNNPRSDYHWQCDACYQVCEAKFEGLYKSCYEKIEKSI